MPLLPASIMGILREFAPLFSERTWDWALVLVVGAVLAPGKRTVTAVLRVMGLGGEKQFQNYHRVLNRAQWSSLAVASVVLRLLVKTFVPANAAIVLGADETLERRRGPKISGLSCFRDAARSSRHNKVKSFGLRWVSMALLAQVPWSTRIWALPFLTVLAPSEETNAAAGRRHKTSIDWVKQQVTQVARWLPNRRLVLVVDGALAALKLGLRCAQCEVTYVTRLQCNARLFDLPPEETPRPGRKRVVGARQPKPGEWLQHPEAPWQRCRVRWYDGRWRTVELLSDRALWYTTGQPTLLGRWVVLRDPTGKLEPCVLFATDPAASPVQIVAWYVMRWSQEVTFEEVRAHLGFESQRQWSDRAVARTSPAILGMFSLVTLLAHHLTAGDDTLPVRSTAWYHKSQATFADIIAYVRRYLWTTIRFPRTAARPDSVNIPSALLDIWIDTLSYAA